MSPAERKRLVGQLSTHGTVEDHETLLHRLDGSDFWVSFSASLSSRENHTEAVFVDITARNKQRKRYGNRQNCSIRRKTHSCARSQSSYPLLE